MPSDHDSLPNPDHLLSSWQMEDTAETICSATAREKETALFVCVSLDTLQTATKDL